MGLKCFVGSQEKISLAEQFEVQAIAIFITKTQHLTLAEWSNFGYRPDL